MVAQCQQAVEVEEVCECEKENKSGEHKHGVILTAEYLKSLGFNHSAALFDLENLDIIELDSDAFQGFPDAVFIDLSYNRIKKINSKVFRNLFSLTELKLNNNEIEYIESHAFDSLNLVQRFDISNNKLSGILRANLINPMINMLVFQASNNNIEDVDWDYVVLAFLNVYNVSSNKITRLSNCNGTVKNECPLSGTLPIAYAWKIIDISANKLKSIGPYDFYVLYQIETLNLNNNEIEHIDSNAFTYNSALMTLSLKHNRLPRIEPHTFDSLINLRMLCLSYNKLERINADTFNPMVSLYALEMQYNRIYDFDWDYIVLEKMEIFNLSYNLIEQISLCNATITRECPDFDGVLPYNAQLKSWDLSHNKIKKLSKYGLYFVRVLQQLDLGYNQIEVIEPKAFYYNQEMNTLNLDYNKLRAVKKHSLSGLKRLVQLKMEYNSIYKFSRYALAHSKQIRDVCLYANPIDKNQHAVEQVCVYDPVCVVDYKRKCRLTPIPLGIHGGL